MNFLIEQSVIFGRNREKNENLLNHTKQKKEIQNLASLAFGSWLRTSHHKQKTVGAVLKNQPDVQSRADFKKTACQLADAQAAMRVRLSEIPFHLSQRASDPGACRLRTGADACAKRVA